MAIRDTTMWVLLLASVWSICPSQAADPDREDATDIIEEIIVTATRREAKLATLPLSVHVLTEKQLRQMGALDFQGYAASVPGLNFTDFGFGGESHTIRGVTTIQGSEINPATSVYLDDVPITHAGGVGLPYSPNPVLVDIERIEVLRGPQGTLFGASSMGGAVRIIPAAPDDRASAAFAEIQASTVADGGEGYELRGMVNEPFAAGRGAVRAVGYWQDADGFIDNVELGARDVNTEETHGGRLAASYGFNDRVGVTGKLTYQRRESDGSDADDMSVPDRQQLRYVSEPNRDTWTLFNLVINAEFDWGEFVSSSAYYDRTIDTRLDTSDFLGFFFDTGATMTAVNEETARELTQEFRVFSPLEDSFHWLAGLFLQDQEAGLNQQFPTTGLEEENREVAALFGSADELYTSWTDTDLEQIAVFGELGYRVNENLEFVLGARWFDIDRNYDSRATGLFNGGLGTAEGDAGEDGIIPKLSVTYTTADGLTLYATAAEGFRPGGVNPPEASDLPECQQELADLGYDGFPIAYDSDSLWSYELGARKTFAGGRAWVSATAYRIDWTDMQSSHLLDCGIGFLENAGSAVNDGFEFSLSANAADWLQFDVGASYIDARLDEDAPNFNAVKGDRVPAVPRFAAYLGLNFVLPPIAGIDDRLRLDYRYVGSSYTDFSQDWRLPMPSYEITNVRYSLLGERWSAMLFVENAFDERGIALISDSILGSWETTIAPRRVGLSLRRDF